MSMRIYFNDEIEDVNVGDEVITTTFYWEDQFL